MSFCVAQLVHLPHFIVFPLSLLQTRRSLGRPVCFHCLGGLTQCHIRFCSSHAQATRRVPKYFAIKWAPLCIIQMTLVVRIQGPTTQENLKVTLLLHGSTVFASRDQPSIVGPRKMVVGDRTSQSPCISQCKHPSPCTTYKNLYRPSNLSAYLSDLCRWVP